ncbi:myb-binding protein 1A-like protein [Triplophysa rosa]|uniref:myb-binding protein 1A-like protein n=1 Tax=Triplophysa rosa TaxID=992332 RepID=UPI002545EFC2|nr:myb-binding protein 1A-like protein [Triplophysa rosa]
MCLKVLCVNLLDTAVENITGGLRDHQQGQACVMVLKALQSKEVKKLMSDSQWTELYQKIVKQITKVFENVQCKSKAVHEKTVKALELCQYLVKTAKNQQKMPVVLDVLQSVLKSMNADGCLQKAGQLEDTYWSVMRLFGVLKPKIEKVKKVVEAEDTEKPAKKKKGFLPETKKRKNRMKPTVLEGKETPATESAEGTPGEAAKKKKKKNKKRKRPRQEEETATQSPAKKAKTQQKQNKKKKKKGGDEK